MEDDNRIYFEGIMVFLIFSGNINFRED